MSRRLLPISSSRTFMGSGLILKSLIHLELILGYGVPRLFLVLSHRLCVKLMSTRGAKRAYCCPPGGFILVGRTMTKTLGGCLSPKMSCPTEPHVISHSRHSFSKIPQLGALRKRVEVTHTHTHTHTHARTHPERRIPRIAHQKEAKRTSNVVPFCF